MSFCLLICSLKSKHYHTFAHSQDRERQGDIERLCTHFPFAYCSAGGDVVIWMCTSTYSMYPCISVALCLQNLCIIFYCFLTIVCVYFCHCLFHRMNVSPQMPQQQQQYCTKHMAHFVCANGKLSTFWICVFLNDRERNSVLNGIKLMPNCIFVWNIAAYLRWHYGRCAK